MTNLKRAIKTRQWTRLILDRFPDDILKLCEMNERADKAVARLNGDEMALYSDWAMDRRTVAECLALERLIGEVLL